VGDPRDVLDAPRAPRREREQRPPAAPRDPFFDQPYQTPNGEQPPAWEQTVKPATRVSANIKTKRKVAALFKAAEVG
jgi:ATP-dependent RNA helicase RhlE